MTEHTVEGAIVDGATNAEHLEAIAKLPVVGDPLGGWTGVVEVSNATG